MVTLKDSTWFAVVNPYAGSGKTLSLWSKAEKMLLSKRIRHCSEMTGYRFCASEMTSQACIKGYRKFIAVGGDGTVHDVLDGIMKFIEQTSEEVSISDFTIAVIPIGSGNDWIKSHNVPNDLVKVISLLEKGSFSRQDIVKVSILDREALPQEKVLSTAYMINVGGVGIDARVCAKVNFEKNHGKRGKILYVKALLQCIKERKPAMVKIICDDVTVFDGNMFSVAFGIGIYSGGGMRQTPDAIMDDGLLDMTLIPELPLMKIVREAPKLFTGNFLTVKELISTRGKVIYVLPHQGVTEPVEVDGEVKGYAPVKFEVLSDQINVLSSR